MKKSFFIFLWQLFGTTEQLNSPKQCGPLGKKGEIDYETASKSDYEKATGLDVNLMSNGDKYSIIIEGDYKGVMIIAMNTKSKKSTGNFKLNSLSMKKHRLLKCYLPRDAIRHTSDRVTKTGTNKFDWEGKCNSFTKFLVFTTKNTKQANYFPGDTNPWLWSKLELSCSQSTTLKAQLDEIVELKISGKNSDYKKTYPRSWQSPAKPAYSNRNRLFSYQWADWASWSSCNANCETGTKSRKRKCASTADSKKIVENNRCTGAPTEIDVCDLGKCPSWSDWATWSTCSRTCGEGLTTRRRYCLFGGPCPGEKEEKKACNTNKCDRDQMKSLSLCKDNYPYCADWKNNGYCIDQFSSWMVENCQYTCGQCKQADNAPECKDTYEQSCWRWKEDGKCESDAQQIRAFVRTKCKKSCNNCVSNE